MALEHKLIPFEFEFSNVSEQLEQILPEIALCVCVLEEQEEKSYSICVSLRFFNGLPIIDEFQQESISFQFCRVPK